MSDRRLLERVLPAFLTADRVVYNICVVLAGLAVAATVLLAAVMATIFGTYLLSDRYKLGEAAMPVMLLGVLAAGLLAVIAFVLVLVFNLR
jgi:Ni/Fe-hydrogenase subunit HybB-like protein